MSSFWRGVGQIGRELLYAAIGQPSQAGPTAQERRALAEKRRQLPERLAQPATLWDAGWQVIRELFKAALWQPSGSFTRKKR